MFPKRFRCTEGLPFAGNVIPANRQNKVSLALMNLLMPLPTILTGTQVTNTLARLSRCPTTRTFAVTTITTLAGANRTVQFGFKFNF